MKNQQLAFLQTNGNLTNESQGHIFVDVQAKDKFYRQESISMHGVSAYESVNKRKKQIFA